MDTLLDTISDPIVASQKEYLADDQPEHRAHSLNITGIRGPDTEELPYGS